jgi:hypothetical protein
MNLTAEEHVDIATPVYLSGASNEFTVAAARPGGELYGKLGLLTAPKNVVSYSAKIPFYKNWGMDNGCYTSKGEFDGDEFLRQIDRIFNEVPDSQESLLFANAPDVFDPEAGRGDPVATIERSLPFLPQIRALGAPAGLVAQDGLQDMIDEIPWDEFDVLFLGGSDSFKLGYNVSRPGGHPNYDRESEDTIKWAMLIHECHERGKGIHVGRSNSYARLRWAYMIGANSADGTFIMMGPTKNTERVKQWYRKLKAEALPAMEDHLEAAKWTNRHC